MIRLMILHCIFYWLLALFEVTIGCFKLGVIVVMTVIFWPCLIIYYKKFGRSYLEDRRRRRTEREARRRARRERREREEEEGDDQSGSNNNENENDTDDDEDGDPNVGRRRRRRNRANLKTLSKRQMSKFLQLVFFRKKKEALDNLKAEHLNCAICLEPFVKENDIIELNCNEGHVFHFGCLQSWAIRQ